jgi:uncharacterized protein (TIGR00255 family)
MKSMTGFGAARVETAHSTIDVSVRAANGRFLEIRTHLPREYIGLESDIKKIIEKYFRRGTLDVFVSRKAKGESATHSLSVNMQLAKQYYSALQGIAKDLKIRSQYHVEIIARLPEVLKLEETYDVSSSEKKQFLATLDKACKENDLERKREGKSLKKDCDQLLASLSKEVEKISDLREEVNQSLLAKFEQKIKGRLSSVEVDANRLSQEIVIQLEKADINEELSRLREHIKNYKTVMSETVSIGKKLDFYTQELLREVNTIGSKSNVSQLTQIVVEAKTIIERLREQVQNIE